jgi:hypothetical protein
LVKAWFFERANMLRALHVLALTQVAAAQSGRCKSLGGTCGACLRTTGCDWCQLDGACFERGKRACKAVDIRSAVGGGSSDSICSDKCTSASCPTLHSTCQPRTNKCMCDPGYYAEGKAGHATLCVPLYREVEGKCSDSAPDKRMCAPMSLGHPFYGCAAATGYSNMKSYCQASCGRYCASHNCKAAGGVDYADFYCMEKGGVTSLTCQDTTAIDVACPHHKAGSAVPAICNDPRTRRDDQCAAVFSKWWEQCNAQLAITGALRDELQGFYRNCKGGSQYVKPPPPVRGCTYKDAPNFNPRATVDDRSCRYPKPKWACQVCAHNGGKCKAGTGHRRLEGKDGRRKLQSGVRCWCPKGYNSTTLCATKLVVQVRAPSP